MVSVENDNIIVIDNTELLLTKAALSTLKKNYPGIISEMRSGETSVDVTALTDDDKGNIALDLEFYRQNPTLPLEDLCARLDNYAPCNDSQREMLKYAQKLVDLEDDSIGAGLYMFGSAGIGKSHIAVGLSKKFMQKGLSPAFIVAEKFNLSTPVTLTSGQVWIIDDMNSGFHLSSRLFKQVVLNTHDRGGRVFVTSNKDYEDLMTELFVGDGKANKMRYVDRTKGMFKILHVIGESFRQANAWHQS